MLSVYSRVAGFTSDDGKKTGVSDPNNTPKAIIYDPELSLHTPLRLWLSTGIRALDHAIETLYRDNAPPQIKHMCLFAIKGLNKSLRAVKANPDDVGIRSKNMLAAWESLWPLANSGPLGLSHTLGYALGATYGIPHGICSCLTLAPTVKMLSSRLSGDNLRALATAAYFLPDAYAKSFAQGREANSSGLAFFEDASEALMREAASEVANSIQSLIDDLGLTSTLEEYKVPQEHLKPISEKVAEASSKGSAYDAHVIQTEILDVIYKAK